MTNPSRHIRDNRVRRSRSPAPVQLSTCNKAALFVTKCVLKSRAQRGENWFRVAHLSKKGIDFGTLLRFIPEPTTSSFQPGQFLKLYKAALECTISPFDSTSDYSRIDEFVDWLSRDFDYSPSALILACIYIDRLFAVHPELFLRKTSVHRCFATAYMMAGKFLEDDQIRYAKHVSTAIRIEPGRLNFLESLFLAAIRHDLYVSEDQLEKAEISFMTEAIESEWSKEVALCLQKKNIKGYRAAVLNKSEKARQSIVELSYIRSGRMADEEMESHHALRRCRPWPILRELAEAQLHHDFENGSYSHRRRVKNHLTRGGQERYRKLRALAHGKTLRELRLPRLSREDRKASGSKKLSRWEGAKGSQFERFGGIDRNESRRWKWRAEDVEVQSFRVSKGCVDELSKEQVEKIMRRR